MLDIHYLYPLLKHNTFGVDVKAAQFVEFDSEDDLVKYISSGIHTPVLTIGAGSNLLFLNDFNGVILHSRIMGTEVILESDSEVLLRVGSGMNWDNLVAYTVEKGWQGLENLSAIPGEVGASAVQNVGAYGVEPGAEGAGRGVAVELEEGFGEGLYGEVVGGDGVARHAEQQ